jgi:hypothetical protein
MCIPALENRCQHIWSTVEPYLVPCAIASGVTFVVNQLWGTIAAISFAGSAVGISIAFPFLVTQMTADDAFMGIARLVLIAVLPFFGTYGIVGSVGLSALASLTQDVRLYSIRAKVAQADSIACAIEKKQQELSEARKAMIKECDERNASAESYWRSVRPVEGVTQALERYERMTQENQRFFAQMVEQLGKPGSHEAAAEIITDIKKFKKFVDDTAHRSNQINNRMQVVLEQLGHAQLSGVVHDDN